MRQLMCITRALADENRVRILAALAEGELCVCQLIELLALAPSTTSKHLAILRQAGLVETRKAGRWIHCRLADDPRSAGIHSALTWLLTECARDDQFAEDRRRLRAICRIDPETLCQSQRRGEVCCPPPSPRRSTGGAHRPARRKECVR